MKKVFASTLTFEYGNVFISGDLYGTEEDFYNDRDNGKFQIIDDKHNYERGNDENTIQIIEPDFRSTEDNKPLIPILTYKFV